MATSPTSEGETPIGDVFAAAFESAPIPLIVFDAHGHLVRMNAAFESCFGFGPHEIRSYEDWFRLAYPDPVRRAEMVAAWSATLGSEGARFGPSERSVTRKDGRAITGLISGERRGGFLHVGFVDLTERLAVEAALRESEANARLVADSISDVIWVFDVATLRPRYISRGVERMLGVEVEQLAARPPDASLTPSSFAFVMRVLPMRLAAFEQGVHETYVDEIAQAHADGTVIWTETASRLVKHPLTGRVELHGVSRDITARRAADERREQLERQLSQAAKLEAVGHLASGVAHDFGNLLTAIAAHTLVALDALPAGHPSAPPLRDVQHATESAAVITRRLLTLTRKRSEASLPDIEVVETIHASAGLLRRLLGDSITLVIEPAEPARVRIDPVLLELALVNAALNARDAMPHGGDLTITVTGAADRVEIGVADVGTGMDEEVMKHLFEPFFTTKPVGRGTGLGLVSIRNSLEEAGGTVRVRSKMGRGTTLTFSLPRAQAVEPRAPLRPPAMQQTVLVVEDDVSVARVIAQALQREGHDVLVAHDGTEAIALVRAHGRRIALVLCDVMLPGLCGAPLVDALHAEWPSLRVAFMSGHGSAVLETYGVATEGPAFIAKPFSASRLRERVRELLA